MKQTRKLLSLLLALAMVCALAATAFAAGTNSITVKNAVKDQEYKLYKMLDLEVRADHTSYSYTVNSFWADFFKAAGETTPAGKGLTYVDIDAQGYVTWKENADVAAFAKDAEEFAKGLTALHTQKASADGDITFSNLEAGYYLVTSTLGTKATVGTTPGNPNPEIQEKNAAPANVKTVQEDSTGNYGDKNDADIGQTENIKSTITAQAGAENYVFHDTMSAGLTYTGVTGITLNGTAVDASNYTVTAPAADRDTFDVTFTQAFCDTLKANDQIVISYTATVNENAVVGLPGNSNESKLSYGDKGDESHTPSGTTPPSTTTTYTWDMDVLKYANGDERKVLKDAKFVLLNNEKSKVATIVNGKITGWVNVPVAAADGTITWPDNTVLTTGENGRIEIDGLDADTYYLREVEAPAGYNKLAADVQVTITGATEQTAEDTNETKLVYNTVTAKVNNQSGTALPSTGGMGTTIFYVIGSVLVLAAVVLLVTKKRMNGAEV